MSLSKKILVRTDELINLTDDAPVMVLIYHLSLYLLDGRSTLRDVLPLVCKRFNFLCKNSDFLWKDALERLIRKTSTTLWIDGIVDFIAHSEYLALTSRSGDSDIADVKDFEEKTRSVRDSLQTYMTKEPETIQALIKFAYDTITKNSVTCHDAYKQIFQWVVNHHIILTYPIFIMRDSSITVDASYGLHFFEPRYRLMMIEIMQPYPRGNSYGLPCNFLKKPKFFYAFHGRVSPGSEVAVVEVEQCFTHPDARADVLLTIKEFVRIKSSWERPNSYGLYEAQAVRKS